MTDWRSLIGVPQCMDAVEFLALLPDASIDAVITDPPYPCIKRDYGYWTVEQWWELIVDGVVPQVRRVLKPTGSAVFILQPNSEHVGQMRGWLWEFMAWVCREWNMVQDVWWWNTSALTGGHGIHVNLLKPAVTACVWAGAPDCYRNRHTVLWNLVDLEAIKYRARTATDDLECSPSRPHGIRRGRLYKNAIARNAGTPHNIIPLANSNSTSDPGAFGHGAGKPLKLADWWTRYICPPGGVVCDPFMGSGTIALAAIQNGCQFVGCDRMPEYVEIAKRRITEAQAKARAELAQPQQVHLPLAGATG